MMKIRDLIQRETDIDVYDDVDESLGIAFCGPLALTDEGEKEFSEVMDYPVFINPNSYGGFPAAIVEIDQFEDWEDRLAKAKRFFESAAGYCDCDDYDKWFKEDAT